MKKWQHIKRLRLTQKRRKLLKNRLEKQLTASIELKI